MDRNWDNIVLCPRYAVGFGVQLPKGLQIFLFSKASRLDMGPIQPPLQRVPV